MKLILEQKEGIETEIVIRFGLMDERLARLVESIRAQQFSLAMKCKGELFAVLPEQILYLESVDGKTFAYTAAEVYESTQSLQTIEAKLGNCGFVRISKSCLLNVSALVSIAPLWNQRYEAKLKNGEKVVVNRHYIGALKQKLGITEE